MPEKKRPARSVMPHGRLVVWMNASSIDRWLSGSIERVRLPNRYGSTLAWRFSSLSSIDRPRLPGMRASSASGKPSTRYVLGFWLNALALPCRMTPIAGLNDPAEAAAFATGGVTGPIGQGSRGGVPIVNAGDAAGIDAASDTATAGGVGGVIGVVAATGWTATGGAAAGLLCADFS